MYCYNYIQLKYICDHENLFHHLEKYVGISGDALKLIKSYFSGRTQRVMIDGILSDVASLICGVPRFPRLCPGAFEILSIFIASRCYFKVS